LARPSYSSPSMHDAPTHTSTLSLHDALPISFTAASKANMPAVPAPNTATSTSSTFLIAPPSLFSKWLNGIPLNVEPHSSSQVKPFACSSIMPESHMGANYVHRNCPRCCPHTPD